MKYLYTTESGTPKVNAEHPFNVLLRRVQVGQNPRKPIAYNVWAKANKNTVDAAYSEKHSSGHTDIKARGTIVQELFKKLGAPDRKRWEMQAGVEHEQLLDRLDRPPPKNLEGRQEYIDVAADFLQPILDLVTQYTGMDGFLLLGTKPDNDNGPTITSLHSTHDPTQDTFEKVEKDGYQDYILPLFESYLMKASNGSPRLVDSEDEEISFTPGIPPASNSVRRKAKKPKPTSEDSEDSEVRGDGASIDDNNGNDNVTVGPLSQQNLPASRSRKQPTRKSTAKNGIHLRHIPPVLQPMSQGAAFSILNAPSGPNQVQGTVRPKPTSEGSENGEDYGSFPVDGLCADHLHLPSLSVVATGSPAPGSPPAGFRIGPPQHRRLQAGKLNQRTALTPTALAPTPSVSHTATSHSTRRPPNIGMSSPSQPTLTSAPFLQKSSLDGAGNGNPSQPLDESIIYVNPRRLQPDLGGTRGKKRKAPGPDGEMRQGRQPRKYRQGGRP